MDVHLAAFLGIAALVIVVPGPDTALVTRNALLHGRSAALATSFGVSSGVLVWTLASALGVAALVRASATAFTTIKLIGAVYLVWLGIQAIRGAGRAAAGSELRSRTRRVGTRRAFSQGMISNIANPKIAVFFTSLVPQFIGGGQPILLPFLVLGGVFVAMTITWLAGYSLMAAKAGGLLTRPRVKAALDRLTGCVLIGLGVRLATER